jgi:hypothetical protein
MNSKDIITWVELQKVDFSNEQSIIKFVSELEGKIMQLDFNLPFGTKAIGYSGSTVKGGTGIYKTIDIFTQNSNGEYGFINNVADNILNYTYKDSTGVEHSLWNALEQTVGLDNTRIIFGGSKTSGVRSPECFSGIKCLNDFVSKQYFLHNGSGNVIFLFTDTAQRDSTAVLTEIDEVLLKKESVTHINGIEKSELAKMSSTERFNLLKEQSVIDMMNANIYRGPDGTEILSFKGTKYENIFKTDITDDYTNVGRYADRVFMSNSELFSKYSFLNSSVSQSILDEFRVGEYRLKTTGVDTLTSKNLYFDNSGLLLSIDKKVPDSSFETTIGDVRQFKSNAEISKLFPDVDFEKLSELEKIQLRQLELEYRRANGILDIDKLFIINIVRLFYKQK